MNRIAFANAMPLSHARNTIRPALSQTGFMPAQLAKVPRARTWHVVPTMIAPEVARNAIAVYGAVIAAGGIGAFLRSGSKPSIISGVVAGIVLGAAYVKDSVPVALGTAVALAAVFAVRLVKTKKFMPAGMLAIVSVAAALFFAAAIYA
ncbi:Transmembrane protein 14-like [Gracilariopsis chorda]|uniref:Transmembrane protein 14-like n=1 Tax=Gracilariopsis chorda TaxID=448386 RepID=A0A2V3IL80_9FLOR|nr:Transmembrane protein 14-like [Gracilariopsis chorda]|eukprot:PXF42836.1 Transmembrane protein 14-like [Gracilariopsis chorda]